jgi:Xaa-Pro aminopeptidase
VNSSRLVDGDLILMDSAPDVGHYTSDIGRMWPVNGKYDELQRTLYGFIVEYHKTVLDLLGPGEECEVILKEAAARMSKVLANTKFSEPSYEEAARQTLEFKGHLSHPVGLEVHDVDNYREAPMKPGLVLSLDPSMWVRDRKTYIRVEDTVAITENGIENYTAAAPLELDDVEATIREDSTLFVGQ